MRIAYIAPYQGTALEKRRPIVRNLSLAGRVKIEMIAELLRKKGHEVDILSQGEVTERRLKLYQGFEDTNAFHPAIPVYYASAFPVRFLNGAWSGFSLLREFKGRHRAAPYDAVLIYNFKIPQMMCAKYASRRLGIPVILEYEDDVFVDLGGHRESGFRARRHFAGVRTVFNLASAATGVTPHLLTQLPTSIPKLLLRGVVSAEIATAPKPPPASRKNWVVFSGTLFRSKGLEQLIEAWEMVGPTGWELHVAGDGELRERLRHMTAHNRSIVLDGLLNRAENAKLLCSAKVGINPHDLSVTPGNVFAFKIVEYLAAGTHVITTPMGPLEPELETGITYIADNKPETIASALKQVIENRSYDRTAADAALRSYGPDAVAESLEVLLRQVMNGRVTTHVSP